MKLLALIFSCVCLCVGVAIAAPDEGFNDADGPHVRVIRNQDGSKNIFKRFPNQAGMQMRMYSADGRMMSVVQYTTFPNGELSGCIIYDGKKNEMFHVRYGYNKDTGKLMEERTFDSRKKDPKLKDEKGNPMALLVRRVIYTYNDSGERNKPICISLQKGPTIQEYLDKLPSTAPEKNPFDSPLSK